MYRVMYIGEEEEDVKGTTSSPELLEHKAGVRSRER